MALPGVLERDGGQVQRAAAVFDFRGAAREQTLQDAVVQRRERSVRRLRQRHVVGKTRPVALALHQGLTALPLLQGQPALVDQHQHVHRQAFPDLADQVFYLFADLQVADHAIVAAPGHHQPQRKRAQGTQFQAVFRVLPISSLDRREPVDLVAELLGTMEAIEVDQVRAGEIQVGDVVLVAQVGEQ